MADLYVFPNSKVMVEDGRGGFREATVSELQDSEIEFPPAIAESIKARIAEAKTQTEAQGIRTGKVKPGESSKLPLNEMPPGLEFRYNRAKLRNLGNDPEVYKATLEGLGYQVEQYAGPWNFAVRKPGQPWRMFDPSNAGDTVYDMIDLLADGVIGVLTSMAAIGGGLVGGPPGAAGAGMAVGTAGDAARQALGGAMGLPQSVEPRQAAMVGAASAAPELLGLLKPAATYAKGGLNTFLDAALDVQSHIVGVDKKIMLARAKRKGFGPLQNSLEAAKTIRQTLANFTDDYLPEKKEAMAIIASADAQNVTGNAEATLKYLKEYLPEGIVDGQPVFASVDAARAYHRTGGASAKVAAEQVQFIRNTLAAAKVRPETTPIRLLEALKQDLQHIGRKKKVYDNQGNIIEVADDVKSMIEDAAKITRLEVERVADASGLAGPQSGKKYSDLMAKVSHSMRIITEYANAFERGKGEIAKTENARRVVNKLWKDSGVQFLDVMDDVDKLVGSNLRELAEDAAIGQAFGKEGRVPYFPRFTPGGQFLGPSIIGSGAAASLLTGNPETFIGGLVLGSPRTHIAVIKGAQMAASASHMVAPTAKQVLNTKLAQAGIRGPLADLAETLEAERRKRHAQKP